MDRRDKFTRIFREEVKDEVARAKIYDMLRLGIHPADTIAKNLISLQSRFPIGRIVKLLNNSKKDKQWVSNRIQELKDAYRKLYKRGSGCAPGLIDVIAEATGVQSSQIYAPGAPYASQIIDRCLEFMSESPDDLSDWEKNILKARIKNLSSKNIVIQSSALVKLTKDTSRPPQMFLANPIEAESYKAFRKSVIPVIDEIAAFYLGSQLWDEMCRFVQKEFKRLVIFVDNEPGSFVNDFYIKFRQQVLDGNTAFNNRKVSFKSYLMNSFRYFLIDKTRILDRQSKQQSAAQEVRKQMGLIRATSTSWHVEAECMSYEKDIILETILCIPTKADRDILLSSFVDGLFKIEGYAGRMTRRALLSWSAYMSHKLGESYEELPRGLQLQLDWYTESPVACFLRTLLRLDQEARRLGHNRQWLSQELGISDRSLGKWIRLEVVPKEESIEPTKNNVARLKRILEVSDNKNILKGEVDYA